ncbi:TPR-like protein [Trametopsis cervina]|nr:TPR-like protein [Trametopsis cervina]
MSSTEAAAADFPDPSTNLAQTPESVPQLTEPQVQKLLDDAAELKQEGTAHFRAKRWNEALAVYRAALGRLPNRYEPPVQMRAVDDVDEVDDVEEPPVASSSKVKLTPKEPRRPRAPPAPPAPEPEPIPLEAECAKARAVLNANIAACYLKLGEHAEVVTACTEAIRDDPTYVKAIQRRAASGEKLNTWSSLSTAQEDYTKLLDLMKPGTPQYLETRRLLNEVKPRVEAAQKRETAEMLGKLKGIGNSILGNFGLSTDNFQFTPNGEGGYAMQFVR